MCSQESNGTVKPKGKGSFRLLLALLVLLVVFILAQDMVRWNQEQFPPEQVYLQIPSPDGKLVARFSVKYESISRFLSDFEPHYYLTVSDLETGRVAIREEKFVSFSLKENFLALAGEHALWCVERLTLNSEPYLSIE